MRTLRNVSPACLAALLVTGLLSCVGLSVVERNAVRAADAPVAAAASAEKVPATSQERLANYFRTETKYLSDRCLNEIQSARDWQAKKEIYRRQLREMLGLDPLPERTPLNPRVTGKIDHPDFTVEKLFFESMPGLYVTGNLYIPKQLPKPVPAILYVCGHGQVKKDGVSHGNKTHYHYHGAWYARNGYVCLIIDTIQMGEIEGLHHGTYRFGQFWWNSRGYSPAGVEAWNGMRAIDLLCSRPEVDCQRIGVTGRSGGGAYSWWVAALDERVKAAVPTAGITDLENHVVDGTVEGHCDCMFQVNTYGWDFAQVAALVAPRALLISNTDKDGIFPLEGVFRVHDKTRRIYRLLGAGDKLGLQITEGGHNDTQELHLHAYRWFNRFLKDDPTSQVKIVAEKVFDTNELRTFQTLPSDEQVSTIQETFVPQAAVLPSPVNAADLIQQRDQVRSLLLDRSFRGWPQQVPGPTESLTLSKQADTKVGDLTIERWEYLSQHDVPLPLIVVRSSKEQTAPKAATIHLVSDADWETIYPAVQKQLPAGWLGMWDVKPPETRPERIATPGSASGDPQPLRLEANGQPRILLFVRGVGPDAWDSSERKQTQIRRRFQLLGQTLAGQRVWDLRQGLAALRKLPGWAETAFTLEAGDGELSSVALHAAYFEPKLARLKLSHLPTSYREGPDYLNVARFVQMPTLLAFVASQTPVEVETMQPADWAVVQQWKAQLKWPAEQFQLIAPNQKLNVELATITGQVKSGAQLIKVGEVIFWTEDGLGFVSPIQDGKFTSPVWAAGTGLPTGDYTVTVRAAGPVAQKYAARSSSGLKFRVMNGTNQLDLDLK